MDICLVTIPYASVERPSMGLSLLKDALEKTQLETTCLYLNLAFAERIGVENYNAFQFIKPEDLVGDMRGLPKPEKTAHFFTQSISSIPDVDIGHMGQDINLGERFWLE